MSATDPELSVAPAPRPYWLVGAAVLVAPAVYMLLYGAHEKRDAITVLGDLEARLIVERGPWASSWLPNNWLGTGDTVSVQVEDPAGGYAYLLSVSNHGDVTVLCGTDDTGGAVVMPPGMLILPKRIAIVAGDRRESLAVVLSTRPRSLAELVGWLLRSMGGAYPPRPEPLAEAKTAVIPLNAAGP